MVLQKKHGKGRLDKWYRLAKEKGYRARAAFKLIQLNKKYGFLEQSKVLLDLCAAPGSWSQVAAETMPVGSLIVGVDLAPIKPISKVITFQSDITTDKCRATIRQYLKSYKADTVLHDGAPNVGTSWVQDSFNQAELVLQSLKLATDFLVEGGTFVTKVFRSKDYNPLLWVFNQLFAKVEATKPPSSRNVSAEIFVVCRGFKAPKRIDPRFLDPRTVFAELSAPTPNNEAKVYKPEIKKRKREGYEEGDYIQFKELPASDFIHDTDPIAVLANYNRLTFTQPANREGDLALAALDKLPETTDAIRASCTDLKVLGRKEFKVLLKWRLRVRELFGLVTKPEPTSRPLSEKVAEEVAEVESMDEEMRLQKDLQALKDREGSKKKREKRKENERKQKEIVRMQMNLVTPLGLAGEQSSYTGDGSMFALKQIDKHPESFSKLARGKMLTASEPEAIKDPDSGIGSSGHTDAESDEDGDRLEQDLDAMYDNYRERKAEADAKYRAKRARQEDNDGEWEGLSEDGKAGSEDSHDVGQQESSAESDDEMEEPSVRALTDLAGDSEEEHGGLSKRAKGFFSQDLFKDIPGIGDTSEEEGSEDFAPPLASSNFKNTEPQTLGAKRKPMGIESAPDADKRSNEDGIGSVHSKGSSGNAGDKDNSDWEDQLKKREDGRPDIELITAEAMTLAHQLATGQKTRHGAIDDGFNKYAFRDRDGLPDWFLDDEGKHDKPHKPISKAAAAAIKEKLRALNARPIKKVREAKARKKYKMAKRLEKLRKKSDLLAGDEGMTEKEKADSITKLISKASKQKPRPPAKLVVAKGVNKGVKGRPRGVPKGRRYKLVDSRMKKELRAQKRIAKKSR